MTSLFRLADSFTYNYPGSPTVTTGTNSSFPTAILVPLLLVAFVAALFLLIIPTWKIYKKAGRPGWASIIPIYGTWVLFEIVGYPAWLSLLLIVPFLGIVPGIMTLAANFPLARQFGKSAWFGVLLIIFPWIGVPILGYGKAQFHGPGAGNDTQAGTPAPIAPPEQTAAAPSAPTVAPQQVANTAPEVPPAEASVAPEATAQAPQAPVAPVTPPTETPMQPSDDSDTPRPTVG